jgi:hypothetical protein
MSISEYSLITAHLPHEFTCMRYSGSGMDPENGTDGLQGRVLLPFF